MKSLVLGDVERSDLVVEGELLDVGRYHLSGFGAEANNTNAGKIDEISKLINHDIAWGTYQDLAHLLPFLEHMNKVVDNRGRGDGLSSPWWALYQLERIPQSPLDSLDLVDVELGEFRH